MSTSARPSNNHITLPAFPVRFYAPKHPAPDPHNRTLSQILSWPDSALEYSHNYIQYLFPLPEPSPINPSAPIINESTFTAFRSRPELRDQLRSSLVRILKFYGFELVTSTNSQVDTEDKEPNADQSGSRYRVQQSPSFPQASKSWLTRFDHNHLRITRIIRCCRVLGLEEEAKAFFHALIEVAEQKRGVISGKSLMFWRRAAERPLWMAPEDDDDDEGVGRGKEWLR
ncbi:MAG: hypothetical protein L6R41_006016 [Letrouitia leprolyta]|nr:MAG: hypothetical protein L6R41_006016 [Letrouitia leprolyta]